MQCQVQRELHACAPTKPGREAQGQTESGPLRAVHLSHHKRSGGLVNWDSERLSENTSSSPMVQERASAVLSRYEPLERASALLSKSSLRPITCLGHSPRPAPRNPHLAPCTLHPAPCNPHLAPCTLHPAPCTLHPAPCTLHPATCTQHPAPCTLNPAP